MGEQKKTLRSEVLQEEDQRNVLGIQRKKKCTFLITWHNREIGFMKQMSFKHKNFKRQRRDHFRKGQRWRCKHWKSFRKGREKVKRQKKIKVKKWKQTLLAGLGSLHRRIERRWSQNKSVNIRMKNSLKANR